jgi:hypothetical protein
MRPEHIKLFRCPKSVSNFELAVFSENDVHIKLECGATDLRINVVNKKQLSSESSFGEE